MSTQINLEEHLIQTRIKCHFFIKQHLILVSKTLSIKYYVINYVKTKNNIIKHYMKKNAYNNNDLI